MVLDELNIFQPRFSHQKIKIIITVSEETDILYKGKIEYDIRVKVKRSKGKPAKVTERPMPPLQQVHGQQCHLFRAIPVSN